MGKISPTALQIISASGGTLPIEDDTSHTGLTGICIECVSDAVIDVCTGYDDQGNAYNFKTERNFVNLYAGSFYYVKHGYHFDVLELTSGKVSVHEF